MIQKIVKRALFGAPMGLTVWMMMILTAAWLRGGEIIWSSGHGVFVYGSEAASVTAQCISAMAIGAVWAAASLIWQETDWSLMKQTAVNFLLSTVPSMVIAWFMDWMPHSLDGIWQYLRLFVVLYLVNWILQFGNMKKGIRQLNLQLTKLLSDRDDVQPF